MKKLRNVSVFLALASLVFFVFNTWFELNIPDGIMDIVNLGAGILVALGILADTGDKLQVITRRSLLEKLKSPVAVGAIFALISYIVYHGMSIEEADAVLKILDTLVVGIFGFSVYNNPNSRNALR